MSYSGKKKVLLFILGLVFVLQGCSVKMAANQPAKKNIGVIKLGASRQLVVTELGEPQQQELKGNQKVDKYAFEQGYSKVNKYSRVVLHCFLDVASFGLWELIATPLEEFYSGYMFKAKIIYDNSDFVSSVQYY
ncbi:MAG: hypothetical protein KC713_02165 [Candidatus Omnitrophica bacterium]|nr:hypothetical protein [Candidatus Omnitrophota bacterium]